jgi:hypothetical protein
MVTVRLIAQVLCCDNENLQIHVRQYLSLSCKLYDISVSHYVHTAFGFTCIDGMVDSYDFTET